MPSELLNLQRAAHKFGVPARWLRDEADAERVPCLRAGARRYLFDADTLAEALRQRACESQGVQGPHSAPAGQGAQ
jgi:hypothetical protein